MIDFSKINLFFDITDPLQILSAVYCENHRLLDFLCLLLSGANMRENIFEYLKLICKKSFPVFPLVC